MKSFFTIFSLIVLTLFATSVFAGQFGPPEPVAKPGKPAFSIGYFYYDSKWKDEDVSFKISQNQIYLEGSYAFVKDFEVYVRVGGADTKSKDFWEEAVGVAGLGDLKDSYKIFGTIGFRGLFYNQKGFGLGGFIQGTLGSTYKDGLFVNAANYIDFKLKNPWDISFGVAAQAKLGGITIYGGPFAYWTKAKGEVSGVLLGVPFSDSETLKEKNNIGGFLGFRIPFTNNLSFNAEGQLKSRASFGANLSYAF